MESSRGECIHDATATAPLPVHLCTSHHLSTFRQVTDADLRMFILAATMTSELDPMPVFLVQDYIDVLLPFLTVLCNCLIHKA